MTFPQSLGGTFVGGRRGVGVSAVALGGLSCTSSAVVAVVVTRSLGQKSMKIVELYLMPFEHIRDFQQLSALEDVHL